MRYAFDDLFIRSGDLRMYSAAGPAGSASRKEFEEARKVDDLIRETNTARLSYDPEYADRRQKAVEEIVKNSVNLYVVVDRTNAKVAYMRNVSGTHLDSTVVLCGSGTSYDAVMTDKLRKNGALVISMGNNIVLNKEAHYWIGSRSPSTYLPVLWSLPNVTKIAPMGTQNDKYFNEQNGNWIGKEFYKCPNTLFYNEASSTKPDTLAELCTFGVDSTLGLGISLAISLGANNIIFNGVDLGLGPGKAMWHSAARGRVSDEERKKKAMLSVRTHLKDMCNHALSAGVRLYTADSRAPFIKTSKLSIDSIYSAVDKETVRNCPPQQLQIPRLSFTDREELAGIVKQFNEAQLVAGHFITKLHKFIEEYPDKFDTPECRKAAADIAEQLKNAKCAMCTKNKIGAKPFAIMRALVIAGDTKALELWQKHFPEFICVRDGDKHIVTPENAELLERYKELKGT